MSKNESLEVTKTYVEFFYPAILFSESDTKVVVNRDPHEVKVPDNCFSFRFFDLTSKTTYVDGKKIEVSGDRKNQTKMYYPDGVKYTIKDIKALNDKHHNILISNMECNNWPVVVKTRAGTFQPFEKGDMII